MTDKLGEKALGWRPGLGFNVGPFSIIIVMLAACVLLALTSSTFLSYTNIYSVLFGVSIQFYALIGLTILMILGEIDLSVGAVYAFSGAFAGQLIVLYHVPLVPALIASLIVSTSFGLLSGFLVTRFRLNSMMITIGMMTMVKGLFSVLVRVLQGRLFPSDYRAIVKFQIFDIHWSIIAMIVIVVVIEFMLRRTAA